MNDTWIGVGAKTGGQLLIGGVESVGGVFINLNNPSMTNTFRMTSSRWGLGLGGGGGLVVMFVFNSNALWWMDGERMSDWGVNVSMGAKWGDAVKFLMSKNFINVVKLVHRSAAFAIMHLDELRNAAHYIANAIEFDSSVEHPTISFDVPMAGVGLELSAFKTSGRIWVD